MIRRAAAAIAETARLAVATEPPRLLTRECPSCARVPPYGQLCACEGGPETDPVIWPTGGLL